MLDIRQTPQYANYLSQTGWTIEQVDSVNYFIKKLPLVGSLIKIQRPEKLDLNKVLNLAKKYRAFQVIVEPKNSNQVLRITNCGFKRTKSPFLPSKTLCLDLNKSEKILIAGFKKDCRQAIKRNKQSLALRANELGIRNYGGRIKEFRTSWKKAVGWKRYVPSLDHLVALKEAFGKNCLFLGTGSPRRSAGAKAGAIFLVGDKVGYYWQAFTNKEGRKAQIQYKIVWEGILWAKKNGAKIFDFEGIYDERFPNKSWLGFTHFKKSFGGYEIEYPGAFVKNLWPLIRLAK